MLCCQEEDIQSSIHEFYAEVLNKQCLLNVEYKNSGIDFVSLCHSDSNDDVAELLISEGWLLVESRREKRLAKLVSQYQKAQEKAKEGRVSIILRALSATTRHQFCSHFQVFLDFLDFCPFLSPSQSSDGIFQTHHRHHNAKCLARSLPPLRSSARTVCPPPAAGPRSL